MTTSQTSVDEMSELGKYAEDLQGVVQNHGHRAVLVSVGFLGIAYDLLRSAYASTSHFIDSAEKRGERLEQGIGSQVHELEAKTADEMKKWRERVHRSAERMNQEVAESSQTAEKELERQIEQVLNRLGIPSRDRLEKLSGEIEELSAKIDQELAKESATVAGVPWPGYDELNAEMLVAKLQKLDKDSLLRAQAYERENKHRVTVLRELDRLLYAYADELD